MPRKEQYMTFDTTKLTQARETMQEILNKRTDDLGKIRADMEKIDKAIELHTAAMDAATAIMDSKTYAAAKSKLETAKTTAEMYEKRYNALCENEMITEADSDAFIDELVHYEVELSTQYEDEALKLLTKLNDLTNEYKNIVKDTEAVLSKWCRDVHANYKQNADSLSAKKVRRDRPVAIRTLQYVGCPASNYIAQNIKSMIAAASK